MNKQIPTKIVRQFVFDILIERSNKEMESYKQLESEDMEANSVTDSNTISVAWESCGTRVMADDILTGQISVKEAIQKILEPDEIQIVKNRCLNWIKEQNKDDKEL